MNKTKTMLPPIPEPHPVLRISLDAVLDHDFERYSNGNMRMTIDRAEVKQGEQVVGHVASVLPAGIVVKVGSRSYYLSPMELFSAVEQAEQSSSETKESQS